MRLRLTLWVVVIFTLIFVVTAGVFWLYQRASINSIFNTRLTQRANAIASEIGPRIPDITREELDRLTREAVRALEFEHLLIDVFHAGATHALPDSAALVDPGKLPLTQTLERDEPLLIAEPDWSSPARWSPESGTRAVLIPVTGADGERYVVLVATTDRFAQAQLALVERMLVAAVLVAPLLGSLSGWFIAGIAVAPFAKLQALARQMGPDSPENSVAFDSESPEVAELAVELAEARERMLRALTAKERFISNVSHEIKTPIAVMLTEAQNLDLEHESEDVRDFVLSVTEEMSRLGKLVESFLTLTRIEEGHSKMRGTPYAANDLAMDSVEHCAVMANQAGVWLRPVLFSEEETMETAVAGDHELLTTMLDNLIRNAIRFSSSGDGVEVSLSRDESNVEVAVRDQGPGIPFDRIDTIFDRFGQAGGSRRGRGHGLGLVIAKGIAELHGGTVFVQNLDVGCEFRVILPRSDNQIDSSVRGSASPR